MTQFILRLALFLCLASAFAAPAGRPPDPLSRYETSKPRMALPLPSNGKLEAVRVIWTRQYGFCTFGLLFAALTCLVMLERKVHRRATGKQARMATALAGALRSGSIALSSSEPPSKVAGLLWSEPEEPEELEPEPKSFMPSRYALLAYDRTRNLADEPMTCVTRQFGARATIVDPELLHGVPRYLLKPDAGSNSSDIEGEPIPPSRWLAWDAQPDSDSAMAE